MRRREAAAAVLLLAGAPRASAQSDWRRVAVPVYAPAAVVRGLLHDATVPRARAFAQAAGALVTTLRASCGPAARAAWREALVAWSELNAIAFGPLLQRRSARRIDFQPVRPALLARAVKSAPQDEAAMERIGSAAKGFAALEALLWSPRPAPADCAYALQAALDLQREADALARDFAALEQADDTTLAGLFGELLNQWIGGLEQLRLQAIERPLRESVTRGAQAFARHRSGSDAAERAARWRALRGLALFAGAAAPPPGAGLAPWETVLRGQGLNPLADRLRQAALRVDAALRDGGRSPAALRQAARQLAALKALAEAELAPALDVRVGFSDADGD